MGSQASNVESKETRGDGARYRGDRLERRFGSFVAVDHVDLAVRRGEIYGFLGPNGAGKSTTTRMLCTLTALNGGRATVAGYDVARQPGQVRLRIGAALQSAALDVQQTGAEAPSAGARLRALAIGYRYPAG